MTTEHIRPHGRAFTMQAHGLSEGDYSPHEAFDWLHTWFAAHSPAEIERLHSVLSEAPDCPHALRLPYPAGGTSDSAAAASQAPELASVAEAERLAVRFALPRGAAPAPGQAVTLRATPDP